MEAQRPVDTMDPSDLHENVDSPRFRPAFGDLTNELTLESPGQLARKRKSLGRRVSFAAKAKVRFIEDEIDDSDNDNGDDNVFVVRPAIDLSPIRPVVESPKSDAVSTVSNESIEVELKDPNSSFTSYSSSCGDAGEGLLDDDMEMTKCVGGIVGGGDDTMDLTGCIGGILSGIPAQFDSPTSVDTMELTTMVGGILAPFKSPAKQSSNLGGMVISARNEDVDMDGMQVDVEMTEILPTNTAKARVNDENVDMDMEMTVVIKDTIKTNQPSQSSQPLQPMSPSPFLVKSPARLSMASPLRSDLSFIGDMDEPQQLGYEASPMRDDADMDLTTELFNRYIDTNRLQALTMSKVEEADQVNRSTDPSIPKTPHTVAPIPAMIPSQTESPTVTIMLPRASLKDFLNETGVRFLDNLSSLNRRETTGRPRESEFVTAAKQMFVDAGLSLEGDILDAACGDLAAMIGQVREELQRQEEQFNHSPPLAFLQHRDPLERPVVVGKLKTLKSIARLYAKQAWYAWRQPVHARLNADLWRNAQVISQRVARLTLLNDGQLDDIVKELEPAVDALHTEVETLKARCHVMETDDAEQAAQLELLVAEQQIKLNAMDEEMAALVKKEQELRMAVERAIGRRQELQHSVQVLQQQVASIPEVSPVMLEELRSGFALLQGAVGWKVVRITGTEVILQYPRADLNVNFTLESVEGGRLVVSGVTFMAVSPMKSKLMSHVSRILKLPLGQYLSLAQCMQYVGQRLDRLAHIDKQLSVVGVQCTVSIPDTLGISTDAVPVALGFYHPDSRTKFDILLAIDGERLCYSQFVSFYGVVQERHVVDAVQLSLQNKYQPVKRLVAAVTDAVNQIVE